ncbi:GntT/GntP/DsdX family permease, partial [Escherichia coli]|uniref:GntT/GntP/DsdX family permease n=1 Tax=Escherichia coli TaxID=562 RepID=UPI00403892F4
MQTDPHSSTAMCIFKFHPFLALLLASFFVGTMMGMGPLDMVNAIESGIGGTLGFL